MPSDAAAGFVDFALSQVGTPYELKDISSMSGGTFTVPAFGSGALVQPGVIVPPAEHGLRNIVKVHNAVHGSDPAKRADLTAVRAVYRRGAKAYSKQRHPASSRRKWAMQRVKQHLKLLASGTRPHPRYTHDDDLLPAGHPLAKSTKGERKALLVVEGRPTPPVPVVPVSVRQVVGMLEGKGFPAAMTALEVKGRWDPDKHPRDYHGRFIHVGAAVNAMIDGKQQAGTVTATRGQSVRVRTADGAEHTVKAASAEVTGDAGPHQSLRELAVAHTAATSHLAQMSRAGHPEASAWKSRTEGLGEAIRSRVKAGEQLSDPYAPPSPAGDLSTPGGLHAHLTGPEHGNGNVATFGPDEHAQFTDMHDRAHQLGATHTHEPQAAPDDQAGSGLPGDASSRPDGTAWGSGYSPADPRGNPAYDRYVTNLDAKITQAREHVGDTQTVHDHVDGVPGAYQPARRAEHTAIINELLASYSKMPREHKAIMLAGPPGSGKSTIIKTHGHEFGITSEQRPGPDGKPVTVPTNYATVNPDDIKEMMIKRGMVDPSYDQYRLGPNESADLIHEESSDIAKKLHMALMVHGTNILHDGTFSGPLDNNLKKIRALRGEGYTVTGVLLDGDVETSLARAGARHAKNAEPDPTGGTPLQGRYVPLGHITTQRPTGQWSDITQRPAKSQNAENFEAAKAVFNGGIRVYDNTGEDGAKLVYSEEAEPGATTRSEGLDDTHLDKLKAGRVGTVSSGDLPGVVAQAMSHAVNDGRPRFIEAGYQGYNHATAPMSLHYHQVTPAGHVTEIHKDPATGTVTRRPVPKADVEKIVDHYVKPPKAGGAGARA
jgi:tRNA A37 threonylcarbamoyladenosine biosynthesis protein TsaE